MMKTNEQIENGKALREKLTSHCNRAIARGDGPIVEIPAQKPGPFPLSSRKVDDFYLITTNQGTHYARTFDPAAASLICAAPDLLDALENLMKRCVKDAEIYAQEGNEAIWAFISDASDAICKARGQA